MEEDLVILWNFILHFQQNLWCFSNWVPEKSTKTLNEWPNSGVWKNQKNHVFFAHIMVCRTGFHIHLDRRPKILENYSFTFYRGFNILVRINRALGMRFWFFQLYISSQFFFLCKLVIFSLFKKHQFSDFLISLWEQNYLNFDISFNLS